MRSKNSFTIAQDLCVKCGSCVTSYPEVFEFGEDGKIGIKSDFNKEEYIDVKGICPVGAISNDI